LGSSKGYDKEKKRRREEEETRRRKIGHVVDDERR